jgi:hypothetical protein
MSLYAFIFVFVIFVTVIIAVSTSTILENQNKLSEKIDEIIKELNKKYEK